jgi:Icc-related predicted phosphoesterase
MRLVCISDNHNQNLITKWSMPEGDVLIHAGDITAIGDYKQVLRMAKLLERLKVGKGYKQVLLVPGNHDKLFASDQTLATNIMNDHGVTTMIDQMVKINTYPFYGTPWVQLQPEDLLKLRSDALCFSLMDCRRFYDRIPSETHVLITHQPPAGILDVAGNGKAVGSSQLASLINSKLSFMSQPITFIFGHNHMGHGMIENIGRRFANVALCDDNYRPAYPPTVIDI